MDRLLLDIGATSIKSVHQSNDKILPDSIFKTDSFSIKHGDKFDPEIIVTEFLSHIGLQFKKRNFKGSNFEIRFHLEPNIKVMKTQDGKSIFIGLNNEGWKFTCNNYEINIDNGLYFGNKNSYTDNQNIFISGISNNQTENIKWEIKKI